MRAVAIVGLSVSTLACSGTTWSEVKTAPSGYKAPKQVKILVRVEAEGVDLTEAIQEMKTALSEELGSNGITATYVKAADGGSLAELNVVEWDPGSRGLRWLGFGGGEGHITVVVKTSTDGEPAYSGKARGYVSGGWYGGSSMNAATEAGSAIAIAIATGKAEE